MFTFGLFAVVALLLASVGIYGTLAYSTSRRTQEIGIRLTLGAARGEVLAMVIRLRGLARSSTAGSVRAACDRPPPRVVGSV